MRAASRRWNWPAITVAAVLAFTAAAGAVISVAGAVTGNRGSAGEGGGFVFLAGYTAAFTGLGYWLCWRHRRVPLEEVIDEIHGGMRRVEGKLSGPAGGTQAPPLAVVRD
jgi:hypothetical protein